MRLPIRLLDESLPAPRYAKSGDAGLDLLSSVDVTLAPGGRAAIPTGIAVAIPEGHAGFVQARSGRALNDGLGVANAPGLIDAGYRGEIKVVAVNLDLESPVHVARGEKIAQLVIQRVENAEVELVAELPGSARGEGGLGSTGR